MNMPNISPGDWISIGKDLSLKDAVVCTVRDDSIEVVYLDNRNQATNEDMIWKDGKWKFKISGPCGGYADKYPRLSTYVAKLRRGRYST
jgi:hypothetical protein